MPLKITQHKTLDNGTIVYKLEWGNFPETKKQIIWIKKPLELKNDKFPHAHAKKIAFIYESAEEIYEHCEKLV